MWGGAGPAESHARIVNAVAALAVVAGICLLGALAYSIPLSSSKARLERPVSRSTTASALSSGAVPPQSFEPLTPQEAELINASVPFSKAPNPAARPFAIATAGQGDRSAALTCLTMAIYYEAASQSDEGEAAVAQVVLNRVRSPLFPKTVCGVVFQGSALATGCQFTFTCDGSLSRRPSAAGWNRAERIAQEALAGRVQPLVGEATHYHTMWVVPYWQASLVKVRQIGAHIFYRWNGALGEPAAFQAQYAGGESSIPGIPGLYAGSETPVVLAKIEPQIVPPPAETVVVPPAVMTAQTSAAQTAVLSTPNPALEAQIAASERPNGFFGGPRNRNQHLAIPGHW
jgi:spore germination cell wall hydrolase CwlJ-like protein